MRVNETSVHLEVVIELLESLVISARKVEQQSDIGDDRQRQRIKLLSTLCLSDRLV